MPAIVITTVFLHTSTCQYFLPIKVTVVGNSQTTSLQVGLSYLQVVCQGLEWAIPFNKHTPPMDDFSVSVPGGIGMLGYLRILL